MDIYFFAQLLVTLGLFLQVQTPYTLNKTTFILIAVSALMMIYGHMRKGGLHKSNIMLKGLDAALALFIVYRMM
jgi:hypothetical protein